jgi:Flp pilus assembly protein protease CpaA
MMFSEDHLSHARLLWAVTGSVPAVVCDLSSRRIPNAACLMLLAGGLLAASMEIGVKGFGLSLLGAAAGFSVFLIFYLAGGMGAGDVKLMASYGSLLGIQGILTAALITAGAGAVVALIAVVFARFRGTRPESIPYAPAIAFGALIVLLSQTAGAR